jgi:hypothetical protein
MRLPLAIATVLGLCSAASAQSVFGGGVTAFDPEIKVLNSGAILDAQAVVSSDKKYVTITARPSNTQLLALRQFSFNQAPQGLGFVGSPALLRAADREKGRPDRQSLPVASALDHRGITKLD